MSLAERPMVGRLVVPFMVDATRSPIDFKALDQAHVDECAERTRCGICGGRIRKGPIAFIGPDDGRTCFADPWMHLACAELAAEQCPFVAGRRDWREPGDPLLDTYSAGMVIKLAHNWRSHRDGLGAWHFEAVGALTTALTAPTSQASEGDSSPTSELEVARPAGLEPTTFRSAT